ncbi:hypothetical protein RZS28_09660 [Methylocapsa polymorpha]|uniref:Uncharacterized protein n=1 Tax=Methylocapsa polymorpha TaxID=3080828 RepID=A0ABZ0HLG3_9HYPH|nr:hypothetical protein RZS28_09660 [Methylocapsa sp. RX1]
MTRAIAGVVGFSAFALIVLLVYAPNSPTLLPDTIFYGVLVLHTYYSVRFFSQLIPQNAWQIGADVLLVAIYFALALSLGDRFRFLFLVLCLFAAATLKYIPSLGRNDLHAILRRKLKSLLSGIALTIYAIIVAVFIDPTIAAWFITGVYTFFTFHILFVGKMYDMNMLAKPE